jgi:hypothetical protein
MENLESLERKEDSGNVTLLQGDTSLLWCYLVFWTTRPPQAFGGELSKVLSRQE